MENKFEHTPPEEQQGWGAYHTPHSYPARTENTHPSQRPFLPQEKALCARVCDRLPDLFEDENAIPYALRQEIQGHLAVCSTCAHEFEVMRRLVVHLEAMPQVELPMDFSGVIQRRIQMQNATPVEAATPVTVSRTVGSSEAAVRQNSAAATRLAETLERNATRTLETHSDLTVVQRVTLTGILTALLGFFVSTDWGRAMLGQNVAAVRAWLNQIGDALNRVPVLGSLTAFLFVALSHLGDLLGETYRTVGDAAVRGLSMDIALGITAYYFLVARRQRSQMHGI